MSDNSRADNGKMRAANESYALKMNIIVILFDCPSLQFNFPVRHGIESPVKRLIHVVSVGTQHVSLEAQTLSVDIQHGFVVTLYVAVGTQLKQLCLWIYNICLWIHMFLSYLNVLQYQIL